MSDDILDASALLGECEGDKELLTHYVEIFTRDCTNRLPKLRAAVQDGDVQTLKEEAHALKGGLGCLFAGAGFKTAYALEMMGADGELGEAEATLQVFETQLQSLRQKLNELIGS